jgi:hypothetical protein
MGSDPISLRHYRPMTRFRNIAWVLALAVMGSATFYFLRDAPVENSPTTPPPQAAPAPAEPGMESPQVGNAKAVETPKLPAANASDPFEIIRGLAKTAYDGDGRAQYLISRELDRCEMTLSLVRKQPGDPESVIWSLPETGWSQPMKEGAIAELRRCHRLLKEDPFADLPRNKDGYSYRYWMDRAVESGYPQAVAERSLSDWSRQTEGGTHALKANSESLRAG